MNDSAGAENQIASCEVVPYTRDFLVPVHTARATMSERVGWHISIADEAGRSATGEAAALAGWSSSTHAEVGEALQRATGSWVGRIPSKAPATVPVPEAQAGLDAALFSLAAQQAGLSLAEHLGSASGEPIISNTLLAGADPEAVQRSVHAAVETGSTTHKLKVGLANDHDRIQAVLEVLPAAHRLRLDANGAWTLAEATAQLRWLHQHAGDRIEYVEDPVGNLDDLRALDSPVPLAADELIRTTADVRRVLAEQSVAMLVVKPMFVGGIRPVRVWAAQAFDSGVGTVLTSTYETEVGLAVWSALAAALPGPRRVHGLGAFLAEPAG